MKLINCLTGWPRTFGARHDGGWFFFIFTIIYILRFFLFDKLLYFLDPSDLSVEVHGKKCLLRFLNF